ncbi:MAG: PorV/PorQ family protein [Ignavibacteriae bacterium]|nr:PorV/PorQ family protein [Ignavibacteriota bacterium]
MKRCYFTLFTLLLITTLTLADEGRKGQAGFQFLRIPMGARQIAMGNSGLASAIGAGAIYWNPAGVASQKGYEAQFSNVSWFGDVSYQHFTGVAGIGELGTIGFAVQYLSYPDIVETTEEAPDGTGATYAPYDLALVVNYSRQMTDKVAFGVNAKYVSETIALVSASALAFDIGLTYNTGYQGLQLGFAISNYGTKGQFTGSGLRRFVLRPDGPSNQTPVPVLFEADRIELPSSVQMGLSIKPVKTENVSLLLNADQVVNTFSNDRTNLGVELAYHDMIFVRGGYITRTDYNESTTGNANFGAGIKYEIARNFTVLFDYAYADLGLLDNAQYITVGLQF